MYDYGWRQYMPDIGRWYGMDQLSEKFHYASPYAYVLNNPLSFIDPDGRDINPTADGWEFTGADMQLLFKYLQGGNNLQAMVSSLAATDNFENNFDNSGISSFWSSFSSSGGGGSGWSGVSVNNEYATYWTNGASTSNYYNIQELIGNKFKLETQYDNRDVVLNSNGDINWNKSNNPDYHQAFNWINSHPLLTTAVAGGFNGAARVASYGLDNWNALSSITKTRVIAETISTKTPFSAQALKNASPYIKWGGAAVGVVGIANTIYQYRQGNISETRAIVDGAMGVAGFFPATAWFSIGYFTAIGVYETYYNNGKPAF